SRCRRDVPKRRPLDAASIWLSPNWQRPADLDNRGRLWNGPAAAGTCHMKSAIAAITALLLSVFILFVGSGLLSTLVPLAADASGFEPIFVGLIGSFYFTGMAIGCL